MQNTTLARQLGPPDWKKRHTDSEVNVNALHVAATQICENWGSHQVHREDVTDDSARKTQADKGEEQVKETLKAVGYKRAWAGLALEAKEGQGTQNGIINA